MSGEVSLRVGGTVWNGWKSVTVTRALDAISGSFSLTLADRWQEGSVTWPLAPGLAVSVALEGETVLSGYIDETGPSFDKSSHGIGVSGRDAACDLVDCSAVHTPGEWGDIRLERLARILAAPFGLAVRCETATGRPIPTFKLQTGETAYEALERACRMRGVLAVSDGRGGIVLAAIGQERSAALEQGVNVLSASAKASLKDRFSQYIVNASQQGSDDLSGALASAVRGEASDPAVPRYRPMVVTAEGQASTGAAVRRAHWEASVRAARGTSLEVTVQGWRQSEGGPLWPLNAMAPVRIPYLLTEQDLLISGVEYTISDSGTLTRLTLTRPDAFQPEPDKEELDPGNEVLAEVKDKAMEDAGQEPGVPVRWETWR